MPHSDPPKAPEPSASSQGRERSESGTSSDRDRDWIERAYDPELLRDASSQMVETLCGHLGSVQQGQDLVQHWRSPEENIADAGAFLKQGDSRNTPPSRTEVLERLHELSKTAIARGQNLQHPLYIGHQVPAPVPLASIFEFAMTATNQVQGVYEMGPWAVAVERAVIEAVGQEIGFEPGKFGGLATSGGSLANLTALLTARNVALEDCWSRGIAGRNPVLVTHHEAHYCVDRTAGILGIGANQIVRVGLDSKRRMDPQQLNETLTRLRQSDTPIVAAVAVAGATPTGAFDPLHAIADVCQRHRVWLHVDAAHGGAACLSEKHAHLVDGLGRADSVVIDAHKMLFVPALCAFVFYRDKRHRFETFQQSAPYLFDPSTPGMAEYDNAMVTVECTKRAAVVALWSVWSVFGKQLFRSMVDSTFEMAQYFYDLLEEDPAFETFCRPSANILVFRHVQHGDGTEDGDDHRQLRIRRLLLEQGGLYITQTKLDGKSYLRASVMNPLTRAPHLRRAVEMIKRAAAEIG